MDVIWVRVFLAAISNTARHNVASADEIILNYPFKLFVLTPPPS